MAVSRVGSWEAMDDGQTFSMGGTDVDPDNWTGTLSVGAGSNRMLVFILMTEDSSRVTPSSFTIGGQAYSYSGSMYQDASPDNTINVHIWNEAAIDSMSGTAIVYYDDGNVNNKCAWAFATYKDVKQASPTITTNYVTGGKTFDLTTTSTSNDMIVAAMIDKSANRHPFDTDSLTEQIEEHSAQMAISIADGAGGDNTTTVVNDDFANSNLGGLAVVLLATTPVPVIHHHRKQIGAV